MGYLNELMQLLVPDSQEGAKNLCWQKASSKFGDEITGWMHVEG
jgi:hypothetical protein